jgi:hypothetical protein
MAQNEWSEITILNCLTLLTIFFFFWMNEFFINQAQATNTLVKIETIHPNGNTTNYNQ